MVLSWLNTFKIWTVAGVITLLFSIPVLMALFLTSVPIGVLVNFLGLPLEWAHNIGLVLGYLAVPFASIVGLKIALQKVKFSQIKTS